MPHHAHIGAYTCNLEPLHDQPLHTAQIRHHGNRLTSLRDGSGSSLASKITTRSSAAETLGIQDIQLGTPEGVQQGSPAVDLQLDAEVVSSISQVRHSARAEL